MLAYLYNNALLSIDRCENVVIKNVKTINSQMHGFRAFGCHNLSYDSCSAYNDGYSGFHLSASQDFISSNVTYRDCKSINPLYKGFQISYSPHTSDDEVETVCISNVLYDNCYASKDDYCSGKGENGWLCHLSIASNIRIVDCTAIGFDCLIKFVNSKNCIVDNFYGENCRFGILVSGTNIRILNSTVTGFANQGEKGRYGISLGYQQGNLGTSDLQVIGNTIIHNQINGITNEEIGINIEAAAGNRHIIQNNIISGRKFGLMVRASIDDDGKFVYPKDIYLDNNIYDDNVEYHNFFGYYKYYFRAKQIYAEEVHISLGNVATKAQIKIPIFTAPSNKKITLIDVALINQTDIAQDSENYSIFQIINMMNGFGPVCSTTTEKTKFFAGSPISIGDIYYYTGSLKEGESLEFHKKNVGDGQPLELAILVIRYAY